ncbi:MAG TPA: endonuclease/exonuclease/phosphatase family protein, partial [Thermomicrobiales bacterium]|nr:endonuclease/exonuclease/phosphatase family protein [Thermomicrobiales bacterium]
MKRRSFIAGLGSLPLAATATAAAQSTPIAGTPVPEATPIPVGSAYGTVSIRVMTFNIWIGGDQVDFERVAEAIQLAKADVVGVQEAEGNIPRLARRLGWSYYDTRMHIVSRFPIIDPEGANGNYVLIEPVTGGVFAMSNVHLPSDPYGPQTVIDGTTPEALMQLEIDTRLPALQPKLDACRQLIDAGFPVFLTGDYNSPSNLDWTATTGDVRGVKRFPFAWPVAKATEDAGFRDSYRTLYPDPAAKVGYTWTAGYPAPLLRSGEPLDRIDFVWFAGDIDVTASQIVGEAGGADVDIPVTPYPSDHRSVVSAFNVNLVTPPIYTSVARRAVEVGERQTVRFHARGDQTDTIAFMPADGTPADAPVTFIPRETWVDGS